MSNAQTTFNLPIETGTAVIFEKASWDNGNRLLYTKNNSTTTLLESNHYIDNNVVGINTGNNIDQSFAL